MKSIANQYRDLKEGKMSQANFMRNLRMSFPQYITNVTSFNDSIKILKNKRILSEVEEKLAENPVTENKQIPTNSITSPKFKELIKFLANKLGVYVESIEEGFLEVTSNDSILIQAANAYTGLTFDKEGAHIDPDYSDMMYFFKGYTLSDFQKDFNVASEEEEEEIEDLINKYEDEESGKYTKFQDFPGGISEAKTRLHPNQVHPSELRMGIQVEREHTDSIEKAEKIALDHLAENPFYYTALKLSGVDTKATPSKEKKAIAKKKDETELVDKANQMKTPKGVEKIKASANKAHKETNKIVKGVQELTHTAKKAKGIKQVMSPTGGKVKTIKEEMDGYELSKQIADLGLNKEKWDSMSHNEKLYAVDRNRFIPKGMRLQAAKMDWDELTKSFDGVLQGFAFPTEPEKSTKTSTNLGAAFDKFKSQLEEIVREVLAENK